MSTKVNTVLFVLACLLLAAVAMTARIMADEIAADADRAIQVSGGAVCIHARI